MNKTTTETETKMNYIIELNGEPVSGITQESNGKANVITGILSDAIKYTKDEAQDLVEWIGLGADMKKLNTTKTTQHTPGPWKLELVHNDRDLLGYYFDHECDTETSIANGRLISAAPELLSALENLLAADDELDYPALVATAKAAIAKAKGQS